MAKVSVHGGASDKRNGVAPKRKPKRGEEPEASADAQPPLVDDADAEDDDGDEADELPEVPDDVRNGSVAYAQAWVGDDTDRAAAMLEYETVQPTPRTTLVASLEKLLASS